MDSPDRSKPPAELTFVTLSPDRTVDSTLTRRALQQQAEDRAAWRGLVFECIGKPAGIREKKLVEGQLKALEDRWRERLAGFGVETDVRPPLIRFQAIKEHSVGKDSQGSRAPLTPHELLYRTYKTEGRLIRSILEHSGFTATDSHDWNVMWLGGCPKPYLYEGLQEHQRINHFPNSFEITRKDRLCANLTDMQEKFGLEEFGFIPQTFVLPDEFNDFLSCFQREKSLWILKPSCSSQGKGIYLVENVGDVPIDESCVVSRYISNPLLVNGLKFDIRLYVLVTCYEPLRIYLYEEGLARFACEPYSLTSSKYSKFMHLTNYSVNKKYEGFVQNEDARRDDFGHKWSVTALMKHLEGLGVDTTLLWSKIYDLIVKTVLAIEQTVVENVRKLGLNRGNCFDLFGFDVLLDANLKPWLLEVNLSPSLGTDSPLDLFIKTNLIADTLNLVGVRAFDRKKDNLNKVRARLRAKQQTVKKTFSQPPPGQPRAVSPTLKRTGNPPNRVKETLRDTLEEYDRRGHFLRLYPAKGCECYDRYFAVLRTGNRAVHVELFGEGLGLDRSTVSQSALGTSQTLPSPTVVAHKRRKSKSSLLADKHFLPDIDTRDDSKHCLACQTDSPCPACRTGTREGKLVITGDDVLVEYLGKIIAILKTVREEALKPQWKRCLEKFVSHAIWKTLDFRRGDAVRLWQRLEVKISELKGRKRRYYEAGVKTKETDRREEQRQLIIRSFSPYQLEAMLRAAQKSLAQELIGCLFDSEGRGVLTELSQWLCDTQRSRTALQLGEGEEEESPVSR